jgi:hypothetical protein
MVYYSTSTPTLISRQFGDEIVLANYDSGLYYSLIGTGVDIWLGLKAGLAVEEIVAVLCTTYSRDAADIPSAVQSFVDHLKAEGLLLRLDKITERQHWSPAAHSFSPPVLERFDDLRDLLLLDPVHEVAQAGWPLRTNDVG